MKKQVQVLCVSASIGSGHDQAAYSIAQELKETKSVEQVAVVDFLAGNSVSAYKLLKETYLKMIQIAPAIYHYLYHQTGKSSWQLPYIWIGKMMKSRMLNLLQQYEPEVVVCTHPFPLGALAYLKGIRKSHSGLVGVITDYAYHPLWVYGNVDFYCVATDFIKQALLRHPLCSDQIFATGIPLRRDFGQIQRSANGDSRPSLLLMGGGLGLGALVNVVEELQKIQRPMKITIVTGRNEGLYESLQQCCGYGHHTIRLVRYTSEIAVLMAEADLLITKPGALTLTEALAMELPMLLYQAIPGQEEENASCMVQWGTALWAHSREDFRKKLIYLLTHDEVMQDMRQRAQIFRQPDSTRIIAQVIQQLLRNSQSAAGF